MTRTAVSVILAALLLISISGCVSMLFPSRSNTAPLFITARDGNVVFRWCGEDVGPLDHLTIRYRVIEDGEKVYYTAAEGDGVFDLREGGEFSSTEAPGLVDYETSVPIPLNKYPIIIFIYADYVEEGRANDLASFTVNPPRTIEDGIWNDTGGPVEGAPC